MGKGKYKNKNQEEEDDFGKKKKNIITQQLLMDKSNMDFTQFIPLLPADVIHPTESVSVVSTQALKKILTDMNYLLYLQAKSFWATVTYNVSFQRCLSSCLSQLSVRWINKYLYPSQDQNQEDCDFAYRSVKDSEAYECMQGLYEVLIKVVYRIMQFQQQDAQLNQIYNFGENTIKKMNVFNMIKLMELVEIYQAREENHGVLKAISRAFLQTVPNPYKTFVEDYMPHIIKKLEQNNRDVKLVSDREQFGINYSYARTGTKGLSPGEEELKRKVGLLMSYISALRFFKNAKFLTEEIADYVYFNSHINCVLQNTFYQLDAAYKIWSFQGVEKRLLPMLNHIFVQLVSYFVEYFIRVNQRVIIRTSKQNVDAYVKSLERFFVDYGKRYSLGKKGASIRHMTLFKLVLKRVDLVKMLEELYVYEEASKNYEFNMEYFIDFKLALEDTQKEDNYINEEDNRQEAVEEETQAPNDVEMGDIDAGDNLQQSDEQQQLQQQDPTRLKYFTPETQDKLQFLISKKSREDDYYQSLYLKQRQRCKIEYDDEYDDLVDYDKRPLFMDQASSDSDSEEDVKLQRLVSNQNNQKANQIKHIKFQEKVKQKKNQPKYVKVDKEDKYKETQRKEDSKGEIGERKDAKVKYVSKNNQSEKTQQREKPKFMAKNTGQQPQNNKEKGNRLNDLIEGEKLPEQGAENDPEGEQGSQQRGGYGPGRGGQGSHKRRYVPVKTHDNKGYKQKGGNSNKNKEYGNQTNQSHGGGKKYREKY